MTDIELLKLIEKEVCGYLKLELKDIHCTRKKREWVEARAAVYYFSRKYTKLTLFQLGGYYSKHHAAVINGITMIENLIRFNGWKIKSEEIRHRIDSAIITGKGMKWLQHFAVSSGNFLISNQN